jgi:hypothetical protein
MARWYILVERNGHYIHPLIHWVHAMVTNKARSSGHGWTGLLHHRLVQVTGWWGLTAGRWKVHHKNSRLNEVVLCRQLWVSSKLIGIIFSIVSVDVNAPGTFRWCAILLSDNSSGEHKGKVSDLCSSYMCTLHAKLPICLNLQPETPEGLELTHIHKTWLEGYSARNEYTFIL